MPYMRDVARWAVMNLMPPQAPHFIYLLKNARLSYLEPELATLDALVAPGSAIDVGANRGLYAQLLSARFERVLALEPQPDLALYLRKVLPPNVITVAAAASDRAGTSILQIPYSGMRRDDGLATLEHRLDGACETVEVRVETLDTLAAAFAPVSLIKIDVEGHELKTLDGARNILLRDRPLLLIEIEERHNPRAAEVFTQLEALGYWGACLCGGRIVSARAPRVDNNNFFFVHEQDPRKQRLLGFGVDITAP